MSHPNSRTSSTGDKPRRILENPLNARLISPIAQAAVLCAALAACSTPPKAPTVDDSTRRPVNDPTAIALQTCRSELSASKAVLTEAQAGRPLTSPIRVSAARGDGASPTRASDTITPAVDAAQPALRRNTIFIVHFELGATEFNLSTDQRDELIRRAREAQYVVVRGRTDATADSPLQASLARQRAQGAADFLTQVARFPAESIRVTWQGAGDLAIAGDGSAQRQANRRVELEFYALAPVADVVAR